MMHLKGAFQEFYYMEDLNELSTLTGCYGNQQWLTIIHYRVLSAGKAYVNLLVTWLPW